MHMAPTHLYGTTSGKNGKRWKINGKVKQKQWKTNGKRRKREGGGAPWGPWGPPPLFLRFPLVFHWFSIDFPTVPKFFSKWSDTNGLGPFEFRPKSRTIGCPTIITMAAATAIILWQQRSS